MGQVENKETNQPAEETKNETETGKLINFGSGNGFRFS